MIHSQRHPLLTLLAQVTFQVYTNSEGYKLVAEKVAKGVSL